MDKYSEFQEREKKLTAELQLFQEKLHLSQSELQKAKDEIAEKEEKTALKEVFILLIKHYICTNFL